MKFDCLTVVVIMFKHLQGWTPCQAVNRDVSEELVALLPSGSRKPNPLFRLIYPED